MNFEEYITPELLILIPVVYAIGAAAKKADCLIGGSRLA